MHVDINSCFATVEQQANPLIRGKPVVVAAYVEDHGCILAASREAKQLGIKTGMRVREAKWLYSRLVVLAPDPDKYRYVNRQLLAVLEEYSAEVSIESIDEMVLTLADSPALERKVQEVRTLMSNNTENCSIVTLLDCWGNQNNPERKNSNIAIEQCNNLENHAIVTGAMVEIGKEIKQRIKTEIGDWMTVSIGIAPNRYLAKVASGLHKPDGLDIITRENIEKIFTGLRLEDLCGIKAGNANRLRYAGIMNPGIMYRTDAAALVRAFHSIVGYHWWNRLHGYEDGSLYKAFGAPQDEQKTFGQSYAFGKPYMPQDPKIHQVLTQLVIKMGRRVRHAGAVAHGIGVSALFTDYSHWGARETHALPLFADNDFFHRTKTLLCAAPARPVRILAVYCFKLDRTLYAQESLLPEETKKKQLTQAIDAIGDRWGEFVLTSGRMLHMDEQVLDRIAFGKVRDLTKTTV